MFSLEPFLASIRANQEIEGIEVAFQEHKISAFVDDIMLYKTNPTQTLPKILEELSNYGIVSNLKINMEKTEILNMSVLLTT